MITVENLGTVKTVPKGENTPLPQDETSSFHSFMTDPDMGEDPAQGLTLLVDVADSEEGAEVLSNPSETPEIPENAEADLTIIAGKGESVQQTLPDTSIATHPQPEVTHTDAKISLGHIGEPEKATPQQHISANIPAEPPKAARPMQGEAAALISAKLVQSHAHPVQPTETKPATDAKSPQTITPSDPVVLTKNKAPAADLKATPLVQGQNTPTTVAKDVTPAAMPRAEIAQMLQAPKPEQAQAQPKPPQATQPEAIALVANTYRPQTDQKAHIDQSAYQPPERATPQASVQNATQAQLQTSSPAPQPTQAAALSFFEKDLAGATAKPDGSATFLTEDINVRSNTPFGLGGSDRAFAPQTAQSVAGTYVSSQAEVEQARNIANQLAATISKTGSGTTEIRLYPEELGRVRLMISGAEGAITVTISAERAETQDLLRRNIDQLAQDFQDIGYENSSFQFEDQQKGEQTEQASSSSQPTDEPTANITLAQNATPTDGLDLRL